MQNSNGALMQLAAFGAMDSFFGDKYATNYNLLKFVKNELTISRSADLCIPLDIIFIMKHKMDTKNFIALVSNSFFKLFLNGVLFFELSFSFLMKLSPVKKVNDSFIIKLPLNILIGYVSMISLGNVSCVIKVDTNCNKIDEISGLFEYIYQDSKERQTYAQLHFYQKIFDILFIKSTKYNFIKDHYIYQIDYDDMANKLGFFIESEQTMEYINILFEKKSYLLTNCEIINDNLLYFSFNGLTHNNNKIFSVPTIKINNSLIISSTSNNLKFYSHHSNIIKYSSGHVFPFSKIYGNFDICDNQNNTKYNMCKKITDKPIVISEITNMKVHNFINEQVNHHSIKENIMKDTNISIIRFVDCTIDFSVKLPSQIKIIIFEDCKIDFSNVTNSVVEIWLINSQQQTNLPIGLKKLRLFGSYDITTIKIPFDCEIEYI